MKISDMVSKLSVGVARNNRYSIIMSVPISGEGLMPLQDVLLFCDQIQLPGLSVQTTPNRVYGEVRETPYEFNYEPLNASFYVDSDMHVKFMFETWIKSLQLGNRRTFNYYDEYVCPQMNILVQNIEEKTTYQVTLYEVYPKTVSPVQMDYSSKDIMKMSVTFAYKYWDSVLIEASKDQLDANGILKDSVDELYKTVEIPNEYLQDFQQFQSGINSVKSQLNAAKSMGMAVKDARNQADQLAKAGINKINSAKNFSLNNTNYDFWS